MATSLLRDNPRRFTATFVATLLGAWLVMTWMALFDVAAADKVDVASAQNLTTMASVVGGWSFVIVTFAVASTLALVVRQRGRELSTLRSLGATPGVIRRLIMIESLVIAAVGILVGVGPAYLSGSVVLDLLRETGQVGEGIGYRFGLFAMTGGAGIVLLAALVGALIAARKAGSAVVEVTAREASYSARPASRGRLWVGLGIGFGAVGLALVTATLMKGKGIDAMMTAGQASILASVSFALLGPWAFAAVNRTVLNHSDAVVSDFVRSQTGPLAAVAFPVILFAGISIGTFYMQATENAAPTPQLATITAEEVESVETLNYVVVAMIAVFLAVMAINQVAAAAADRRSELARLRIAGATSRQVFSLVATQALVVLAIAVVLGTTASLFTALPFSYARTGSWMPDGSPLAYLLIILIAAALTLGTTHLATMFSLRTPAIRSVAVAS